MADFNFTMNLQVQANAIEDLAMTMDEIKKQILSGSSMAHDRNNVRRYALSIEEEVPFEYPDGWVFRE